MLGDFSFRTLLIWKVGCETKQKRTLFLDGCTLALKIDANPINSILYVTSEYLQQLQDMDQVAEVSGMIGRIRMYKIKTLIFYAS